jgi:hypothetical protein
MAKEGLGVKLAVWFPTTKSWESIRPQCVQVECDTLLESSQGELQVCFKPHPNRRSKQRVMISQSPEIKSHSDVSAVERHKEYYMWEGGGFP